MFRRGEALGLIFKIRNMKIIKGKVLIEDFLSSKIFVLNVEGEFKKIQCNSTDE